MIIRTLITTALALVLAACSPQPPHVGDVCVESHTDMIVMPQTMCSGQPMSCRTTMMVMPITQCDRYERRCIVDRDYQGPETCEQAWAWDHIKQGMHD